MSMFVHDTNNTHIIDYHMYIVFGNFIFSYHISLTLFISLLLPLALYLSLRLLLFLFRSLCDESISGCFAHFLLIRSFSPVFASISA